MAAWPALFLDVKTTPSRDPISSVEKELEAGREWALQAELVGP